MSKALQEAHAVCVPAYVVSRAYVCRALDQTSPSLYIMLMGRFSAEVMQGLLPIAPDCSYGGLHTVRAGCGSPL